MSRRHINLTGAGVITSLFSVGFAAFVAPVPGISGRFSGLPAPLLFQASGEPVQVSCCPAMAGFAPAGFAVLVVVDPAVGLVDQKAVVVAIGLAAGFVVGFVDSAAVVPVISSWLIED